MNKKRGFGALAALLSVLAVSQVFGGWKLKVTWDPEAIAEWKKDNPKPDEYAISINPFDPFNDPKVDASGLNIHQPLITKEFKNYVNSVGIQAVAGKSVQGSGPIGRWDSGGEELLVIYRGKQPDFIGREIRFC